MAQITKILPKVNDKGIFPKRMPDGKIKYIARIVRTDAAGEERQFTKQADSLTEARKLKKELEEKHKRGGTKVLDGDRMTFGDLAQKYREWKVKPAQFDESEDDNRRKIAGLKSWKSVDRFLQVLIESFQAKLISQLIHADIEKFKLHRVTAQTVRGRKRKISSVNRELEVMRAVLNYAVTQGWLLRTPFEMGSPLISKADEVQRNRVLSHEEEEAILSVCIGKRAHLRPILICLADTAMRSGEVFQLERRDVDLDSNILRIRMKITKTDSMRVVPITPRLRKELESLLINLPKEPEALVFGVSNNIKRSFTTVCKLAKVSGLRVHDYRHTAITRMLASECPATEVMKISGHSNMKTFLRYLNPTEQTLVSRAGQLDEFNRRHRENLIPQSKGANISA